MSLVLGIIGFVFFVLIMMVGIAFKRPAIKGSCGGISCHCKEAKLRGPKDPLA